MPQQMWKQIQKVANDHPSSQQDQHPNHRILTQGIQTNSAVYRTGYSAESLGNHLGHHQACIRTESRNSDSECSHWKILVPLVNLLKHYAGPSGSTCTSSTTSHSYLASRGRDNRGSHQLLTPTLPIS